MLPNGTAMVTAQVTDQYGNVSAPASQNVTVDKVSPVVTGVSASPASGRVNTAGTITITLTMSEPVTVSGVPLLLLNDGGIARYDGHSSLSALAFNYTVQSGQVTPDLQVAGAETPLGAEVLIG
jgi:hypothetical protein